eukprot:COSAG01_NODE_283_length_19477_cov_44.267468_7_plen_137_part_00
MALLLLLLSVCPAAAADFDTRIHLLVKGPGIAPGSVHDFIASNVDLTPTFLSLAGLELAPGMDGRSILPLLLLAPAAEPAAAVSAAAADRAPLPLPGSVARYAAAHPAAQARARWRTTHFIEYHLRAIGTAIEISA